MGRISIVLIALVVGFVLAGAGVGLLVPQLPDGWREERLVWGSAATVVALCVLVAFLMSRPARR